MQKPEYNPDMFPFWVEIPIRFRDLDPLKHVNNAIFSTYYEESRIKFIADLPAFAHGLNNGFSFVLANININFIAPVKYPARLLIGSGIKELGNTSISSFQAIYHAETKKLISVAEASGVWFDLNKQRPARVPQIENTDEFLIDWHTYE